jgi:DUF4097 and DUF4098 domain-containing protein YvlB
MVIRVPSTCALEVSTDTGSITVSRIDGSKRLESDTGPIRLHQAKGDAELESDTGDVRVRDTSGDLFVRTDTGSIELDGHDGVLRAESDTGRISGSRLELRGDSTLEADTGSIDLRLSGDLGRYTFDIATDTGAISVGSTRARGKLVLGSGPRSIRIRTDTGSVRIE